MSEKMNSSEHEAVFINFLAVPSLQDISLCSLVATAFRIPEIKNLIRDPDRCSREETICELKVNVLGKLEPSLPQQLKNKAAYFIRPLKLQIFEYSDFMRRRHSNLWNSVDIYDCICWNSNGTLDEYKTFESLLKSRNEQNVKDLFEMACHNCFDDFVLYLWKNFKQLRNNVYNEDDDDFYVMKYWMGFAEKQNKEVSHYDSSKCKEMLESSIAKGNGAATRYFWLKLPDEMRNKYVMNWTESTICELWMGLCHHRGCQTVAERIDIVFFFMSQLREENQQREVLQTNSKFILRTLFCHWPWQVSLLPTMQAMSEYLDEDVYVSLILTFMTLVQMNQASEFLFRELWHQSPIHLKKGFISTVIQKHRTLWHLFEIENTEMTKFTLSYANSEEKNDMLASLLNPDRKTEILRLIELDRLELYEWLLKETVPLEVNCYKKLVIERYSSSHLFWSQTRWLAIEKLLDWYFASDILLDDATKDVFKIVFQRCVCDTVIFRRRMTKFVGPPKISNRNMFDRFVTWCSGFGRGIDGLKPQLLPIEEVHDAIITTIKMFDFEFAEKILRWYFVSGKEIKDFKERLISSEDGKETLMACADYGRIMNDVSESNHRKLFQQLALWYRPVDKELISKLEEQHNKESNGSPLKELFQYLRYFSQDGSGNFQNCYREVYEELPPSTSSGQSRKRKRDPDDCNTR